MVHVETVHGYGLRSAQPTPSADATGAGIALDTFELLASDGAVLVDATMGYYSQLMGALFGQDPAAGGGGSKPPQSIVIF